MGCEGAGPGDITMAERVGIVGAFAEDPAGAGVTFSQGEIIGGDVLLVPGEALLNGGELIHE